MAAYIRALNTLALEADLGQHFKTTCPILDEVEKL